jgi:hypothetical protein
MIRRSAIIALVRAANASFFLTTSLYCLLSYNAFAFQQFIKPHLIAALTGFFVWYGALYWIVLLATALTLLPSMTRAPVTRRTWIYLAVSAAIGVWLLTAQVLPEVEDSRRSLVLATAALVPPFWLAIIDHLAIAAKPTARSDDRRLWKSGLLAALVTWAAYAGAAPFRPRPAGAIAVSMRELLFGASSSAIAHVTVFVVMVLFVMTIRAVALASRSPASREYWLLAGCSAIGVAAVVMRQIFAPIAFRGAAAWAIAALAGTMIAATWSSIARYRYGDAPAPRSTAMDLWLAPIVSSRSRTVTSVGLLLIPFLAYFATQRVTGFDWNFMIQKLIALAVWLLTFAFVHAAIGSGSDAWRNARAGIAVPAIVLALFTVELAAVPRLPGWIADAQLHPDFILDGYASIDPSYKLIHEALTTDAGADPAFYAYLRENSTIHASVAVQPVDVQFVQSLAPTAGARPHIFLFLIDSLRRDYVSTYNPAVSFTPRIAAFAHESGSYVFDRAFSRYGGTGLSVPAIWTGGMILHKEYVTPFAPMNALEKLIDRNGYQRFITKDHISDLFTASASTVWLDRDIPEMDHSFCGTMRELETDLRGRPSGAPPIFALTRPLDLHVSKIRGAAAPVGESYPGFDGAYASRVRRIDACFGQFIDTLKQTGLYADSAIVVMADHGDSLGEEQRWGHAYTLFPEVMRIPLMVHVPLWLAAGLAADLSRVSFSTDVTPTLYALLGYRPADLGPLFGVSLLHSPAINRSPRERESRVVASSYGAVYGVLSHNGRELYIADAINEREYAYDIDDSLLGTRVGIGAADRARNRALIRTRIEQLASEYHFRHEP